MELPQTFPYVTQLRYGRVPGLHKQESDFSVSIPLLEDSFLPRPDSNQVRLAPAQGAIKQLGVHNTPESRHGSCGFKV